MPQVRFTWDARKARENEKKHGISFVEAQSVFYDENARLLDDPEHSYAEDRFILLGLSARFRFLVVCHCYREVDGGIRIFSARRATRHEQRQYTEYAK